MNIQKPLRRIARLGITNFETVAEIERLQRDLLRRLERSSIDPERYEGLADCGPAGCAREECMEACFFGTFRRRLRQVPAALRLLKDARPPFHEVRVSRALWSRPFGKLNEAGITAAKQLNRRALDSLYDCGIVAVGTFKVAPSPPHDTKRWICEIHQVVAGSLTHELERALSTREYRGEIHTKLLNPFEDHLRVKEIQDLWSSRERGFSGAIYRDGSIRGGTKSLLNPQQGTAKRVLRLAPGPEPACPADPLRVRSVFPKKLEKGPPKPPPPKRPSRRPPLPQGNYFGSDERYRAGTYPNCANYIGGGQNPPRMHVRLRKYFEKSNMDYYND